MAAADSIAQLRDAVEDAARALGTASRPSRPRSSTGRRSPSWATTAPTRRCSWPDRSGTTRGRSPSACASSSRRTGDAPAASSGSRSRAPGSSTSSSPTPGTCGATLCWAAGEALGPAPAETAERVLVEFVSANPTGPLHVGGGRHAAYGDTVVRLLQAVGHRVEREFYVNDAGAQVEQFADSIAARMADQEPPEDGYTGAYVTDLANRSRPRGSTPSIAKRWTARYRVGPRGRAGESGAVRRQLRHLVPRARSCTGGGRWRPRLPSSSRPVTPTVTKMRSGCARPRSATTKTGF